LVFSIIISIFKCAGDENKQSRPKLPLREPLRLLDEAQRQRQEEIIRTQAESAPVLNEGQAMQAVGSTIVVPEAGEGSSARQND